MRFLRGKAGGEGAQGRCYIGVRIDDLIFFLVLVLVLSEAVLVIEGIVKKRFHRFDGRARAPSQATEHEHVEFRDVGATEFIRNHLLKRRVEGGAVLLVYRQRKAEPYGTVGNPDPIEA